MLINIVKLKGKFRRQVIFNQKSGPGFMLDFRHFMVCPTFCSYFNIVFLINSQNDFRSICQMFTDAKWEKVAEKENFDQKVYPEPLLQRVSHLWRPFWVDSGILKHVSIQQKAFMSLPWIRDDFKSQEGLTFTPFQNFIIPKSEARFSWSTLTFRVWASWWWWWIMTGSAAMNPSVRKINDKKNESIE